MMKFSDKFNDGVKEAMEEIGISKEARDNFLKTTQAAVIEAAKRANGIGLSKEASTDEASSDLDKLILKMAENMDYSQKSKKKKDQESEEDEEDSDEEEEDENDQKKSPK